MRLRNKKTGEIRTLNSDYKDGKIHLAGERDLLGELCYGSLEELCEEWDDAPEEKKYGGKVPGLYECYFAISDDGIVYTDQFDPKVNRHSERFESGSAFWTEEEAEKELARRKAYVILEEDIKGFKPDWKNYNEEKHFVCYDYDLDKFGFCLSYHRKGGNKLYFATEEDAKASVKAHEKEWKTWLGVEDE